MMWEVAMILAAELYYFYLVKLGLLGGLWELLDLFIDPFIHR